jgi:uncharacterized sulfatase
MGGSVGEIPDQLRTAAEFFSEQGYRTACVTTNPRIVLIGGDAGFDEYFNVKRSTLLKPQNAPITLRFLSKLWSESIGLSLDEVQHSFAYLVTELAKRWLRSVDKPYFLYAHYNEPHRPFNPPLPYRDVFTDDTVSGDEAVEISKDLHSRSAEYNAGALEMSPADWEAVKSMYDSEIAYTDSCVGRLYDAVQAEDPAFVVTADHGEMLGENGIFSHGQGVVRDEVSHVPLVVSGVSDLQSNEDELVQHTDVMNTVLTTAGIEQEQFAGIDLRTDNSREFVVTQEYTEDYTAFTQYNDEFDPGVRKLGRIDGLRTKEYKLVVSENREFLYKLPDEATDVAESYPDVSTRLREQHDGWNSDYGQPLVRTTGEDDYDKRTKQRLEDLGYIQE